MAAASSAPAGTMSTARPSSLGTSPPCGPTTTAPGPSVVGVATVVGTVGATPVDTVVVEAAAVGVGAVTVLDGWLVVVEVGAAAVPPPHAAATTARANVTRNPLMRPSGRERSE